MRGDVAPGNALLKAVAFVVFIATLAGASYGVGALLGDKASAQALRADPLDASLNATAGHAVTFPVKLQNRAGEQRDVAATITGLGQTARSAFVTTKGGANQTVFVTFQVPAGTATGSYPLNLSVVDAAGATLRTSVDALRLEVVAPQPGLRPGQGAEVRYTIRSAENGLVYESNDPALAGQTFAHSATFFGVSAAKGPSVVYPGWREVLYGTQQGESRSVTFGPEKGAGNATIEESEARILTLERNETVQLRTRTAPLDAFAQFLQSSGQGNISEKKVGDVITIRSSSGESNPYRITALDNTSVTLLPDVHVGEVYTIYSYFPRASRVTAVENESVTLYTAPEDRTDDANVKTYHVGDNLTVYPWWPQMSQITSVTNDTIVIAHNPTLHLQFARPSQDPNAPQITYTVSRLSDTEIFETTSNTNPLAGKAITVDFTIVKING